MIKSFKEQVNMIGRILESFWVIPISFTIAFICWICNITLITPFLFWALFVCILVFCKDVKNIFPLIIYIPFFLVDIKNQANIPIYIAIVVVALTVFTGSLIFRCVKREKRLSLGKLFMPLIVMDVAFLLAGVIGRFNFIAMLCTLATCVVTYALYFVAVNFTKNLGDYFCRVFIAGGLFLPVQILIANWTFFSAQSTNVASIFLLLAIVGCFGEGVKKKHDFVFMSLSFYFIFGLVVSRCRMGLLLGIILEITIYVIKLIHTNHKSRFILITLAVLSAVIVFFIIFPQFIMPYIEIIIDKTVNDFLSDREIIFATCFEKFLEYPIFGFGYFVDGAFIDNAKGIFSILLAHNSLVQWITSLGLIGASLTLYFYIVKYKIVGLNIKKGRIFPLLAILSIALSGLTDPSPTVDFFVFLLPILIVAGEEKFN